MIESITITLDLKTAATVREAIRAVKPSYGAGTPEYDRCAQVDDVLTIALQDAWRKNRLERLPKRVAGEYAAGSGV